MKEILYVIAALLLMCGGCNGPKDKAKNQRIIDTTEYYFWWEELSPEDQIKHFDSLSTILQEVKNTIDTLKLNE